MMVSIGLASLPEDIEQPENEDVSIHNKNTDIIFTYDTVKETLFIDPCTYSKKEYHLNELNEALQIINLITAQGKTNDEKKCKHNNS